MILATWCAVNLNGTDLLVSGEYLDGEFTPPDRILAIQEKPLWRAASMEHIARGLVKTSFTFRRVKKFDTGAAARAYALAHRLALPTTEGNCTITGLSGADNAGTAGGVWTLSSAVLTGYAPGVFADRFFATYTITGGLFVQTTAPT